MLNRAVFLHESPVEDDHARECASAGDMQAVIRDEVLQAHTTCAKRKIGTAAGGRYHSMDVT